MKLIPRDRREWLWLSARLGVLFAIIGLFSMFAIRMPGKSYSGPLPHLTEEEATVSANLKRHVTRLADEIGERNMVCHEALKASENHIENVLSNLGCKVSEQAYEVGGKMARNIETELGGGKLSEEILVIGAHYDSVEGTAGANDNASGVAALLELARLLESKKLSRKVRFVAFVNEEPPYFMTRNMGSLVYARRCRERNERVIGMLSLETIGCYTDKPQSQRYPWPFSLFYPSTGNFIAFVGNFSSRGLVRQCVGAFRRTTQFPSEGAAVPGGITGVGWSDHWSFWQAGYKALMVTDTALFRYHHYHTPLDTPEKLDYSRMARVVCGLARMIEELANGE